MKHKKIKYVFPLLFLSISHLYALTNQELEDQIVHGLFEYDESFSEIAEQVPEGPLKRVPKDEAVAALTGIVDAQDILQEPLYYRSNPVGRRNIIDVSIFQQFSSFTRTPSKVIEITPFYTQTYKEYYFDQREAIDSYLNIKQETLVDKIDRLELTSFDLPEILGLFSKIKLQERNAGFMFGFTKATDLYAFAFRIPFYWTEHNFYLNKKEQDAIINHPAFADFKGDFFEYAQKHLISDALALGDTKVQIEFLCTKSHKYQLSLGGRATLPTRVRLKKGLLGNYFNINAPQYSFDLYTDLLKIPADLTAPTDAEKTLLTNNAVALTDAIIDRLSTMLLEQGNENNHHFGIGVFMHSIMHFNEKFSLSTLSSIEALLPSTEKRFYIIKNDKAAFDAFNWSDTAVQIDEKLAFLDKQFKEKFFLPVYPTSVFPGFIFQNTSALTHHCHTWDFTIGSDFWFQTREYLGRIITPSSDIYASLQIETAQRKQLYQGGMWLAAEKHPSSSGWQWGGKMGWTSVSNGIGKDVSIALHFRKTF